MENTTSSPIPSPPPSQEEKTNSPKTETKKSSKIPLILGAVIAVVGVGLLTYFIALPYLKKDSKPVFQPTTSTTEPIISPDTPPNPSSPSLPSAPSKTNETSVYTTLEQDFPNLTNNKSGLFSPRAKELLRKNGFVVVPASNEEFFNVYQTNTTEHMPHFITTDSLLHTTHLVFKHLGQHINGKKDSTADFLNSIIEQLKLTTVSGVHIPASFGSPIANKILADEGEALPKSSNTATSTNPRIIGPITKGVQEYDLAFIFPLVETKPGNLPDFMKSEGWSYKGLATFLGSWTELISTSPSQIPVAAVEGIGGPSNETEVFDERGYVEPEPYVYQRVAELTKETRLELEKNKKLSSADAAVLTSLEKTALTLKAISDSEINKIPLSENAHEFIKKYPEWLKSVWEEVYRDEIAKNNGSTAITLAEHPVTSLANAALLPASNSVLQVGTGKVFDVFVIVTVNGKQKLARGGVYSYYEFLKPAAERVAPADWNGLISNTTGSLPPELPKWAANFIDTSALGTTK